MDIGDVIIFTLLVLLLGILVDVLFIEPVRADAANSFCVGHGFDQYKSYTPRPFSTVPYGVKCELVTDSVSMSFNE